MPEPRKTHTGRDSHRPTKRSKIPSHFGFAAPLADAMGCDPNQVFEAMVTPVTGKRKIEASEELQVAKAICRNFFTQENWDYESARTNFEKLAGSNGHMFDKGSVGRVHHIRSFFSRQPAQKSNRYRRLSSFDAPEVKAFLRYLKLFERTLLEQVTKETSKALGKISKKVGATIPHADFMAELDKGVSKVINTVSGRTDAPTAFARQIRTELRLQLYRDILRWAHCEGRKVEFAGTWLRDGPQSQFGSRVRGSSRLTIAADSVGLPFRRIEVGGGAQLDTDLLERTRGSNPDHPFIVLEKQLEILGHPLAEYLNEGCEGSDRFGYNPGNRFGIDEADWNKIFGRFRATPDRAILSEAALRKILHKSPILRDPENEKHVSEILRRYDRLQTALVRGVYLFSLEAHKPETIRRTLHAMHQYGIDVFRIFDAFNRESNVLPAMEAARACGAKVQPCLVFSRAMLKNATCVDYAKRLIHAAGDSLDTFVIKDAGGQLTPEDAFTLVSLLRGNGIKVPIEIHTHNTGGEGELVHLEAIRANGEQFPIVVDLGLGKLGEPLGQPDAMRMTRLVAGTKWGVGTTDNFIEGIHKAHRQIDKALQQGDLSATPFCSRQRMALAQASFPGGMISHFHSEVMNQLRLGVGKSIEGILKQHKLNVSIFEADPKESRLTPEGYGVLNAVVDACIAEKMRIVKDFGEPGPVTPSSQWLGNLALMNVVQMITKGVLVPQMNRVTGGAIREMVPSEAIGKSNKPTERSAKVRTHDYLSFEVAKEDGKEQKFGVEERYRPLSPPLVNVLMQWIVSVPRESKSEVLSLRDMYPEVDPDLCVKVIKQALGNVDSEQALLYRKAIVGQDEQTLKHLRKAAQGYLDKQEAPKSTQIDERFIIHPTDDVLAKLFGKETQFGNLTRARYAVAKAYLACRQGEELTDRLEQQLLWLGVARTPGNELKVICERLIAASEKKSRQVS